MVNKNEKIEAAILLSSYLDTLGFKNGQWEFNYRRDPQNVSQAIMANFTIVNHYMALGGFNNIDITNWKSSDDTLLIMATIKALIDGGKEIDYIKRYIEIYNELVKEERVAGMTTLKSISYLKKIIQKKSDTYLDKIPFDDKMGGNGAAIRTGPIGIFYSNNLDKIISESIIASRLTHNIPMGYLGGLVSALFASYAFNGIDSWLWLDKLLELVKSGKITKYINGTDIGNKHDKEINSYFSLWYKYKEDRLQNLLNFRGKSEFIHPKERLEALSEYIPSEYFRNKDKERWYLLGASGLDSCIYAYDSLLMSLLLNERFEVDIDNPIYNPETFLFFSTLHVGDSDSTGAIAGFWFGALLGFNGFDTNKMKQLEFYKELKKLCNNFI
jgi:ADP-ribosylarginine hydrolase